MHVKSIYLIMRHIMSIKAEGAGFLNIFQE
jgi:hypothetical protein